MPRRQPAFRLMLKQGWQLRYSCADLLPSFVYSTSCDRRLLDPLLAFGLHPPAETLLGITTACQTQTSAGWQLRLPMIRFQQASQVRANPVLYDHYRYRTGSSLYRFQYLRICVGVRAAYHKYATMHRTLMALVRD